MRVNYYKDNLNQDRMDAKEILRSLKNHNLRKNVVSNLTKNNDPDIIQEMMKLFDDDDIEIRGEVFSTLFLNQNDILKDLILGLKHESKNVRAYVTLVLANRNEKNAIKEIRKLTNDPSGLVRTCAYGALGHLEAKESAKELHRGVFDSNLEAVKSAAYALTRIGEKILDKEIEELHKLDELECEKILKFFN
ncbi:MAG: HEAT repeat domain-containing protein [Crenarchaeota archaeon]|nr:HEAT repeat domain-containing protein [Thermoproteota archaeon]MDA1124121.1 HEAT repeat domain-containing protein [Thermoproteota archaeon]